MSNSQDGFPENAQTATSAPSGFERFESNPPDQKLDPRVKNVWRLGDGFGALMTGAIAFAVCFAAGYLDQFAGIAGIARGICLAAWIALIVICVVVLPPIRYARWRYAVSEDYLEIARGIIWRRRTVIPFIRVQNTDTRQGPVLRLFKLASVTVSTAADEHEIPGLALDEAERLRNRTAELARLAREDV